MLKSEIWDLKTKTIAIARKIPALQQAPLSQPIVLFLGQTWCGQNMSQIIFFWKIPVKTWVIHIYANMCCSDKKIFHFDILKNPWPALARFSTFNRSAWRSWGIEGQRHSICLGNTVPHWPNMWQYTKKNSDKLRIKSSSYQCLTRSLQTQHNLCLSSACCSLILHSFLFGHAIT